MKQLNNCSEYYEIISRYGVRGCASNDYIQAEELDEVLETEKDSIESQINLLDNEISSLKSMVNNNIKNSCGLQLIGG